VYWKSEVYDIIPELKIDPVGSLVTVWGCPRSSLTHAIVVPAGIAILGG
jgi:hypothetical protein